jgi:hypothetical protein
VGTEIPQICGNGEPFERLRFLFGNLALPLSFNCSARVMRERFVYHK